MFLLSELLFRIEKRRNCFVVSFEKVFRCFKAISENSNTES